MKKITLLLTTLLLVFLIAGCSDKESGIFYSIEEEREVEDNTIENGASIGSMVYSGGNYYVAAGDIFYMNPEDNYEYHLGNGNEKWKNDTVTPDSSLSYSIAEVDGSIYGVFYSINDSDTTTTSDLYRLESGSWIEVTGAPDVSAVEILSNDDNTLGFYLGYTYSDDDESVQTMIYSIYAFDGSDFTELSDGLYDEAGFYITTADNFDVALDQDSSDPRYWLTCGPRLFTISQSGTVAASITENLTEVSDATLANTDYGFDDTFQCIHYSTTFSGLLLAKADDTGFFRPDDGDWTDLEDEFTYTVEEFFDFTFYDETDEVDQSLLLLATESGYFELETLVLNGDGDEYTADFTDPSTTANETTYEALDLDAITINSFFDYIVYVGTEDEENILFALTQDGGLWSNGYFDGTDTNRVWDIE